MYSGCRIAKCQALVPEIDLVRSENISYLCCVGVKEYVERLS